MSPPPQTPYTRFPDRDLFDRARALLSSAGPPLHRQVVDLLLRAEGDPALSSQILACARAPSSGRGSVSVPIDSLRGTRPRDIAAVVRHNAKIHNLSRGSVHPPDAADSAQVRA